jgi:TRAP-type C4-dicarboxylate transport system permease large subunit
MLDIAPNHPINLTCLVNGVLNFLALITLAEPIFPPSLLSFQLHPIEIIHRYILHVKGRNL